MFYAYLASLVFGGVLLGSSVLFGGHDAHVDGHVDMEGALDGTSDLDGHGSDRDGFLAGDGANIFFFLGSLRFWTFFVAFFGLTGITLDGLGLIDNPMITLALSVGMGFLTGAGTAGAIRALANDESGSGAHSGDYVGRMAKVIVPVRSGGIGKVRVEVKGQLVDVLATCDEALATSEEALIIEMEGTRAKLARIDGDWTSKHRAATASTQGESIDGPTLR